MKILYTLIVIFLSALIGTALGELICFFIPHNSYFFSFFSNYISPVWELKKFDLIIMDINFLIQFKINVLGILGMVLGAFFSLKKF